MAIGLEHRNGKDIILHRCQKCGFERKNRVSPEDDFNAILALSNGTFEIFISKLLKNIDK